MKYYDDISVSKRNAKSMAYLPINMAAVDVHKRDLVLKMGSVMIDILLRLKYIVCLSRIDVVQLEDKLFFLEES